LLAVLGILSSFGRMNSPSRVHLAALVSDQPR
jgi:hypothetical protein